MKVLIIGGTGLISTPITRMLWERGDDVTLYNRAKRQPELLAGVRQMIGDRTEHAAFEAQMQAAARWSTAWAAIPLSPYLMAVLPFWAAGPRVTDLLGYTGPDDTDTAEAYVP
jgi:nucleoside-diphosphate-sugar epimerase